MNDVINREDAIDAVLGIGHTAKLNDGDTVVRMSAVNYVLRNLPSAQPEPCEDAVSREAVTDVIRHSDIFSTWYEMDDTDDIVAEVIDEARKQLVDDVNELPSVTPKCPECDDAVSREAAIDAAENAFVRGLLASPDIRRLPSAQPEIKPISYQDCANAMMMMWMADVLTDGEYRRIMDKLNDHESRKENR